MSIPNLITVGRILLVPILVWAIASGEMGIAFVLFVVAGISDGVDGFLAKHFGMASDIGRYLDPLADKVLIVSIYVSLGVTGALPRWLVILVVSRDIIIVGGVLLAWIAERPIAVRPLLVSKLNTAAQIVLAGLVLAMLGFGIAGEGVLTAVMAVVTVLTLLSVAAYVREWVRHMSASPEQAAGPPPGGDAS